VPIRETLPSPLHPVCLLSIPAWPSNASLSLGRPSAHRTLLKLQLFPLPGSFRSFNFFFPLGLILCLPSILWLAGWVSLPFFFGRFWSCSCLVTRATARSTPSCSRPHRCGFPFADALFLSRARVRDSSFPCVFRPDRFRLFLVSDFYSLRCGASSPSVAPLYSSTFFFCSLVPCR